MQRQARDALMGTSKKPTFQLRRVGVDKTRK
jgi:hypothetical protein